MASSEPNSIKEKAIFKSNFYYTATCLALGNVLLFVGTGTGSSDLQLPRAHEYRMAVTQKEPTPPLSPSVASLAGKADLTSFQTSWQTRSFQRSLIPFLAKIR